MHTKPSTLIWKTLFLYITKIIRNTLYVPYATALFLYLFIFIALILGTFLSTDFGINFINSTIKILFEYNILNESMQDISKTYTLEETKNILLFLILSFAILYDLIERAILSFNKKLNRLNIRKKFFKITLWIYVVTFTLDSILIIFSVKDMVWFGVLIMITLLNIVLLGTVYLISMFFGWILDSINK